MKNYIALLFLLIIGCSDDSSDAKPELSVPIVAIDQVNTVKLFCEDLGGGKISPAIEYFTHESDEPVIAVCSGRVKAVHLNEGFTDYEIHVTVNSKWLVIYDHVKNVTVEAGDKIEPGDVLGTVGDGNRVELQINRGDLSYCPLDLGTDFFITQHQLFQQEWCLCDTVVP